MAPKDRCKSVDLLGPRLPPKKYRILKNLKIQNFLKFFFRKIWRLRNFEIFWIVRNYVGLVNKWSIKNRERARRICAVFCFLILAQTRVVDFRFNQIKYYQSLSQTIVWSGRLSSSTIVTFFLRKFKFELVTFQNIVGNVKNVAGHLV